MPASQDNPTARRRPLSCPDCDAHLDVGQSYCVTCGARVRPLPHFIAATLAAMAVGRRWAAGTSLPEAAATEPAATEPETEPMIIRPFGRPIALPSFQLPSPRGAAIAILGVLAFTVAVTQGSSLAGNPLVIFEGHNSTPLATVTPATSTPAVTPSTPSGNTGPLASNTGASPAASSTGTGTGNTGAATSTTGTSTTATNTTLPPIKHVFIIQLGDQPYANTFSDSSTDTYLNSTLAKTGELLPTYYATGTSDLANEDALISGQGPTPQIDAGCPTYDKVSPGLILSGQAQGDGCVFSNKIPTLFNQLTAEGDTWKTYVQGMGKGTGVDAARRHDRRASQRRAGQRRAAQRRARRVTPQALHSSFLTTITNLFGSDAHHLATAPPTATTAPASTPTATTSATATTNATATTSTTATAAKPARKARARTRAAASATAASCRHPALGAADPATVVNGKNGYVTFRNPAVYFQSITGAKDCADDDVGLNTLASDLKSAKTVPSLSMIYADPCDDGSATGPGTACPDVPDATNAANDTTGFLKTVVAEIEASPAYKHGNGLILITFAMDPQNGSDSSDYPQASCCNDPPYPNLEAAAATPTTTTPTVATTTTGTTSTTGTVATTTTVSTSTSTSTTANTGGTGNTGSVTATTATGTNPDGSVYTENSTSSGTVTTTTITSTLTGTTTTGTASTGTGTGTTTCPATGGTGNTGVATTTTGTDTTETTGSVTSTEADCTPAATTDMYGNPATGGGGQVGLLAISKWVTPGSQDVFDTFNNFSLLASLEELYGITTQLGFADTPGAAGLWGKAFFSEYTPGG